MPRAMGWSRAGRNAFAAAATVVAVALTILGTPVAAAGATPKKPKQNPPPPAGWLVDRVRFEPLDGAPLGIGGLGDYRGAVEVARSDRGLAAINEVALDDYLRGISEVPVSWPAEAQKAQAIAARTYVLRTMQQRVAAAYTAVGADICATQACQVYSGMEKERRPGSEAWNAAVDQTQNLALLFKGKPINAKYSSSNGGRSVAGGEPYLRVVDDPDDVYSPLHEWRTQYPLADVQRALGVPGEATDIHRDGDQMVTVAVDADGAPNEYRIAVVDFRSRVNDAITTPAGLPLPVPSDRFGAGTYEGQLVIEGRGWGHGIGLSQFGALGKALRGMKAPDILAAYYSGLRPVSVPTRVLPATVKVALALDRSAVAVSNVGGHFRVVAGDGMVVAHRASGAWTLVPETDGRVRIVPPADQSGASSARLLESDPTTPIAARPLALRVALDGPPAITRFVLHHPDGRSEAVGSPALRSGEVTVKVAASASLGTYRIEVERDPGGGRTTTIALTADVAVPADNAASGAELASAPARSRPPTDPAPRHPLLPILAATLLGAVAVAATRATGVSLGRTRGRPLH